jgi:hypothetical protein
MGLGASSDFRGSCNMGLGASSDFSGSCNMGWGASSDFRFGRLGLGLIFVAIYATNLDRRNRFDIWSGSKNLIKNVKVWTPLLLHHQQ